MAVNLTCPDGASDTGAYRLSWAGADGARYVVKETGPDGAALTVYEGEDTATTVSGRPAGTYRYRVEAGASHASCEVRVEPPSFTTAMTLFGFGLFVTVATVLVVVRGHRAHRRGEIS